jgi:hypothetical protein
MSIFAKNFVIRGKVAKKKADEGKGWERRSEDQIDAFFGVSGQHWTPRRWKELCNEKC